MAKQGLIQEFELGGGKEKKDAISACAEVGGSGGMPPQENFENGRSEVHSGAG